MIKIHTDNLIVNRFILVFIVGKIITIRESDLEFI
jgi:hypothetical protein